MKELKISSVTNFSILCIALCILFYPGTNAANEKLSEAEVYFVDGKSYFDEGNYLKASKAFRAAHTLKPSWKLLFNIAQSDAAAKNYGLALDAFEQYLTEGGDEISVEREYNVAKEIERLKSKVGSFSIIAPEAASIYVDDIHRGDTPLAGKLRIASAREFHLVVKLSEQILLDRMIKVGSGEAVQIDASSADSGDQSDTPPTEETSSTLSPPKESSTRQPLKAVGWTLVGVGSAMLLTATITGGAAMSKSADLEESCPQRENCTNAEAQEIHDSATNLALATNVFLIAAGLSAATGLVILLVNRKKQNKDETQMVVAPAIAPGFGGLFIQGRF